MVYRFGRLPVSCQRSAPSVRALAVSGGAGSGGDEGTSFLDSVRVFFERAAEHSTISPALMERMRKCANVTAFNLPVRMDDGNTELFKAFRGKLIVPSSWIEKTCKTTVLCIRCLGRFLHWCLTSVTLVISLIYFCVSSTLDARVANQGRDSICPGC